MYFALGFNMLEEFRGRAMAIGLVHCSFRATNHVSAS